VIITSPEYNKGISGVLKNALDWVSRMPVPVWKEKPVVIMSAAAGRTGGETSQYMVRACLTPFGPRILNSPIICVAQASQQFDEDGQIISEIYLESIKDAMRNLQKAMN
jgi:chromate reductase